MNRAHTDTIDLVKVNISNRQKDLPVSISSIRSFVHSIIQLKKVRCRELSIYFVSERKIIDLHRHFFNDPTPTDCITFPIDAETLGEIFVCPKAAIRYTAKKQTDPYDELALYVIHGILHLLGYDDMDSSSRRLMRRNEKKCMDHYKSLKTTLWPK